MNKRYVEQIMNIYNHVDTIILTDEKGYIVYYMTYRPDVNPHKPENMLGKHMLEAFKTLTEETSSVMRVIRNGEPILNEIQEFEYDGMVIPSVNTTMPIREKGVLVGTACMVRYLREPFLRNEIVLDLKENENFSTEYSIDDIKGCSKEIQYLKSMIRMVGETDSSVLIYGETGTGKELAAQAIHGLSRRRSGKFVSQNCAAIPEALLESLLFGTVKGAYTGSVNRPGLFEIARGGTLFLDEINSMELGMQSKLLRAIEDKEIVRVGGGSPIKTDVRIISALNENPLDCIKNNKLRNDLFYRLSVVELEIEPLRRRREDVAYMTDYYIKYYNEKMNRAIVGIDDEVKKIFDRYSWPGNVRELRNVIEGAFNIAVSRTIEKRYLPNYLRRQADSAVEPDEPDEGKWDFGSDFNLDSWLREYERNIIIKAIKNSKNLAEAARKLGISRQNLNYKLSKHSLLENNTFSKYNNIK